VFFLKRAWSKKQSQTFKDGKMISKFSSSQIYQLRRLWPELLVFFLGIGFRVLLLWTYDPRWSYDFDDHWHHVEWFQTHIALSPADHSRVSYHAPLYYVLGGILRRLGVVTPRGISVISIVSGMLRLVLFWWGLKLFIPNARVARLFALALAAVLPSSIHLDGMVTNEALSCLFSTAVLLATAVMLRGGERKWVGRTLILAALITLYLYTKVSAFAILASITLVLGIEVLFGKASLPLRIRRVTPIVVAMTIAGVMYIPFALRQRREFGHVIASGFDRGFDREIFMPLQKIPYLDRRPLGYFIGWSNDIYKSPYYPAAISPHSRFFPVVIASTFADYYNYGFAKPPPRTIAHAVANSRPLLLRALTWGRISVVSGSFVAVIMLLTGIRCVRTLWRRRDTSRLLFLVAPLVGILGQLHFATHFALDIEGPVKGSYLQFACLPLCALFGLGVTGGIWRKKKLLLLLPIAALMGITGYTVVALFSWFS